MFQAAELLVYVGSSAEVHCPYEVVESIIGEVARPVALEQSHLVEARLLDDVTDFGNVGFVDAV